MYGSIRNVFKSQKCLKIVGKHASVLKSLKCMEVKEIYGSLMKRYGSLKCTLKLPSFVLSNILSGKAVSF